ncbi:MAG: type II toxin-antitoxin system PemK/MazF family toxin [Patulibacter sp.]|nr:type II toxin-antitoxin system PemK/MazF family toxin [Patulibacter sp.]
MVRGEVLRLPAPRRAHGREQQGVRYGIVVQADELLGLSTVLVAPTSTRARPAPWRPRILLDGVETSVLVEQTRVVDAKLVADRGAGRLEATELREIDDAFTMVLGL